MARSQWPGFRGCGPGIWKLIETYTADGTSNSFDFSATLSSRWSEYEIVADGLTAGSATYYRLRRNGNVDTGGHREWLTAVDTTLTVYEASDSALCGMSLAPGAFFVRILAPNSSNPIVFGYANETSNLQSKTFIVVSSIYLSGPITSLGLSGIGGANYPSGMRFRLLGRR